MLSRSVEDYTKVIYRLEFDHKRATTQRIAEQLDLCMASVTEMIKHLAAEGYLKHRPYYGVKLTDKGRRVALGTIRRHRLIELFLQETLGLNWDEVHEDAEVLEHAVSDRLIERIFEFLGHPEFDPHGAPIPRADGSFEPLDGSPLSSCEIGARGTVLHVSDRDPEILRYLSQVKIRISTCFRVMDKAPLEGPLTLRVGKRSVVLGAKAARRILVALQKTAVDPGQTL